MQDNEPILINVAEAARLMGIGRNTMLKFAKINKF